LKDILGLCGMGHSFKSCLKNRILVQDSVFATQKAWLRRDTRGTNPAEKGGKPKDIFEIAFRKD